MAGQITNAWTTREDPVAEAESWSSASETLGPVDQLIGCWWLGRTKSRMEKALAMELKRLGVGFYLPLLNTKRQHGGRIVDVAERPALAD